MKCRENMKIDYKGSAKLIFDFFVKKKDMDVEDKLELLYGIETQFTFT